MNKRRLEAVLAKILGLKGLEGLEDDDPGAAKGKAGSNAMKAKMLKVRRRGAQRGSAGPQAMALCSFFHAPFPLASLP